MTIRTNSNAVPDRSPVRGVRPTGMLGGRVRLAPGARYSLVKKGFTLVELLTVIAVIGVLFAVAIGGIFPHATNAAKQAKSGGNLRQLAMATHLYLIDHDDAFFPYRRDTDEGVVWFFGMERREGSRGEGERELDRARGPLHPYLQQIGGVEICPGFDYGHALWKPKFKGASWGYGYNVLLGPMFYGNGEVRRSGKRLSDLSHPSRVILFGTCAQVNTFQAPASPANPMLEEFYIIDDTFRTVHFRFGGGEIALFTFTDGSIRALNPYPGTIDQRLPEARVGRVTPRGSTEYLE